MMLAKLSATATSRQIADSTRMTAARPLMAFIDSPAHSCRRRTRRVGKAKRAHRPTRTWARARAAPFAHPTGQKHQNLLVALGGGEEHLPQRLELGLALDDVVAD